MSKYKQQSAEKAFQLIKPGLTIGLGDGSTVIYLAELIAANQDLSVTLKLTSSSVKTILRMEELGLTSTPLSEMKAIDLYFDGCDQFDRELNALKSGSGIHSIEKILAGMARKFILIGDQDKFSEYLTSQYPVVVEIIPAACSSVSEKLKSEYALADYYLRAAVSERGNRLLELKFLQWPALDCLNTFIKMLPGVLDHSLFYHMANSAIISGPEGTRTIFPVN